MLGVGNSECSSEEELSIESMVSYTNLTFGVGVVGGFYPGRSASMLLFMALLHLCCVGALFQHTK